MISVSSKMELGKDRAQAGNAAGRPILECLIDFRGKNIGLPLGILTGGGFGFRFASLSLDKITSASPRNDSVIRKNADIASSCIEEHTSWRGDILAHSKIPRGGPAGRHEKPIPAAYCRIYRECCS
jgi:hypothetical protein